MRKQKILICDTDRAYLQALSTYFISSIRNAELSSYSSVERFCEDRGTYDVALLGREFVEIVREDTQKCEELGQIFILTGDIDEQDPDYQLVYKFQQMQSFISTIRSIYRKTEEAKAPADQEWTGIFSPMRHELQLPFALAYCAQKQTAQPEKSLLFLDLEENSLFGEMTGFTHVQTVMDYLYLQENEHVAEEDLRGCLQWYQGFACLAPARYFQELIEVNPDRWQKFFASVTGLGFDQVVVLFDGSMRGMKGLFHYLHNLLLLGRDGDYYRKYDKQIRAFLKERKSPMAVRETVLPLTGASLSDGTYQFEQLLSGNLSQYARTALEEAACGR